MKSPFLLSIFLFLALSNYVSASGPKLIKIKMPSSVKSVHFSYRDSNYKELLVMFSNEFSKDTVISKEVKVKTGQVLSRLEFVNATGKSYLINQSFIVPIMDTIQFELGLDKRLVMKSKPKFFVEDILELDREVPTGRNLEYFDALNGLKILKSIFEKNNLAIAKHYSDGIITDREKIILSTLAKTDYYYRILSWAAQNNQFSQIDDEIVALRKDQNEIQAVISPYSTQLFSAYVGFTQRSEKIEYDDINGMVKAILKLGWGKNITFAFINYILSDIKGNPKSFSDTYYTLRAYLDGDYSGELEKLRKKILPVITNLNEVRLVSVSGTQTTLRTILDKNPGSYFLIDFWASWCVPCREEAPFFERAKAKYASDQLVFMSFSTDVDKEIDNWKKALKNDKLWNATNHYKLIGSKSNVLFSNFSVPTIPRYILINDKGEFIDPEFPRPSTPEFEQELKKILIKHKQ